MRAGLAIRFLLGRQHDPHPGQGPVIPSALPGRHGLAPEPAGKLPGLLMCVRPSPPSMGCMRTTRACEECLILGDSPHFRAWRDALRELMDTEWAELRGRTGYSPGKFTEAVYQEVVAGRPRLAGALAALEYFGVPDAGRRAPLFAAVKQEHLVTLIEAGECTAFDDAIRFVLAAKAAGIPIAAASFSKNADLLAPRPHGASWPRMPPSACRRPRPAGWPLSAWPAWATLRHWSTRARSWPCAAWTRCPVPPWPRAGSRGRRSSARWKPDGESRGPAGHLRHHRRPSPPDDLPRALPPGAPRAARRPGHRGGQRRHNHRGTRQARPRGHR